VGRQVGEVRGTEVGLFFGDVGSWVENVLDLLQRRQR
jgi:hypothetical protein